MVCTKIRHFLFKKPTFFIHFMDTISMYTKNVRTNGAVYVDLEQPPERIPGVARAERDGPG